MQDGDYSPPWIHDQGTGQQRASWPKYRFIYSTFLRDGGSWGRFTIREPPLVDSSELEQRVRSDWYPDGPTPLEEDSYTICIRPGGQYNFTALSRWQFVVGRERSINYNPAVNHNFETHFTLGVQARKPALLLSIQGTS